LLEQAIAKDSSFAEAHAALAQTYATRLFRFEPNSEIRQRAADEIRAAIAIDSGVAEAYHARGNLAYTRESGWQLDSAMRDFKRALALKPNDAAFHASYGTLLFTSGCWNRRCASCAPRAAARPAEPLCRSAHRSRPLVSGKVR
jgi:Tfp pilus assembly protein PilF